MKVRCPKCGELIDVPKSGLIGQMRIKELKKKHKGYVGVNVVK